MYGFTSEDESVKLRECLLAISECKIPNLYYKTERDMLMRCWASCCGSRCLTRCANSKTFTEHDARDIYAIHCRIPQEKKPDPIKPVPKATPRPKQQPKQWMS